jgi:hypothetical protein
MSLFCFVRDENMERSNQASGFGDMIIISALLAGQHFAQAAGVITSIGKRAASYALDVRISKPTQEFHRVCQERLTDSIGRTRYARPTDFERCIFPARPAQLVKQLLNE